MPSTFLQAFAPVVFLIITKANDLVNFALVPGIFYIAPKPLSRED